jgi:hypothetical protein
MGGNRAWRRRTLVRISGAGPSEACTSNSRRLRRRNMCAVSAGPWSIVIVDLQPESPTYLRHGAVELSAGNQRGIYLPERFAHGYRTLEDDTDTLYMMGEFYTPGAQSGLRHDDPILGLSWPLRVKVISEKDRNWKLLEAAELELRQRMSAPGVALSNVAGLGHCSGAEG